MRKIKAYYGSKISANMIKTPEGYLICKNVPIGRTGWMDYLGEELGLYDMREKIIKVYRSPEELFSKTTMASFEGKSVTNNHPSENLTLDTVGALERGHVENVRQDGEFLIADLYIKDVGLINEVENNIKREVSCGYDCLWVPIDDSGTRYEQKEIVGNHVAVVQNGRAGSRVAIKDSKPEQESKTGGKKNMKNKSNKSTIFGKMIKAFAQDADPEEVQEAMDALNEDENGGDEGQGESSSTNQAQDDDALKQILQAITNIGESVKGLTDRVTALESAKDEDTKKDAADEELEGLEKEIKDESGEKEENGVQDDDAEVIESQDEDPEDEKSTANDSAGYLKLIKDMKPVIMGIPDEKTRLEVAKQFTKSVRDSRAYSEVNGYKDIVNTAARNKRTLMDEANNKAMTREQATQKTADAWNKQNAFYKGGN